MADTNILVQQLGAYDNMELSTNNKSIIKAINELYINQQILLATSTNIFRKLNLSLGDLTEDEELREAYVQLKFNSVFDGLVQLENKLSNGLETGSQNTLTQINEVKAIIGTLDMNDTELKQIFTELQWGSVLDGLIQVDNKITSFIKNSNQNVTNVTTALRDSITTLRTLVGTTESDDEYRTSFSKTSFTNILAAIVELNNFTGYSTDAFDALEFNNMLEMLINTYNQTTSNTNTLNRLNEAETKQASVVAAKLEKFNKNLQSINSTTASLVSNVTTLQTSLQSQAEYIRTGFENIMISIQKLSNANDHIVELVGDISTDSETKSKYDEAGYTSTVDGIVKLTDIATALTNTIGNVNDDDELKAAFVDTGYENVIQAVIEINTLLGNLATNNVFKAAFKKLGFSNVVEGIVQLSDSLQAHILLINQIRGELITHAIDENAHSDIIPSFLVHHAGRQYEEGERVYIKELPNYMCLECVSPGTTNAEKLDFESIIVKD